MIGAWQWVAVLGALAALAGLYRRIARAAVLRTTQVIVVSRDPRQTPDESYGRLVTYDPRFVAAGGPPAAVAALARDLGVADVPATPPAEADPGGAVAVGLSVDSTRERRLRAGSLRDWNW